MSSNMLCVSPALLAAPTGKIKTNVWPVPPGCLHFSWLHVVCVSVCNNSRVISLQSSSSRAESYWEIFCMFMTRNTNHNGFILLYKKPQNKTLGTLAKKPKASLGCQISLIGGKEHQSHHLMFL